MVSSSADDRYRDEPPRSSCRVLARIGEVKVRQTPTARRASGPAADRQAPAAPSYRFDPPQPHASSRPHRRPADEAAQVAALPPAETAGRPAAGDLDALPAPIRLAVLAWQFFQPYKLQLRAAALFALVAVCGMSMVAMIAGGSSQESATPPRSNSDATVATDDGAPQLIEPHREDFPPPAEERPEFSNSSNTPSISTAPTAIGPGRPTSQLEAMHAAERPESSSLPAADEPARDQPPPPTTSLASVRAANEAIARGRVAAMPSVPAYPTTSYPTFTLPDGLGDSLPRVQTNADPPAVARLRGDIEEVQAR